MAGNEFEECYPAERNALLEWKDYEDFGFILLGIFLAFMVIINGMSSLWDYRRQSTQQSARQLSTEFLRQKSQADAKVSQVQNSDMEDWGLLLIFDLFSTQLKAWGRVAFIRSSSPTIN